MRVKRYRRELTLRCGATTKVNDELRNRLGPFSGPIRYFFFSFDQLSRKATVRLNTGRSRDMSTGSATK